MGISKTFLFNSRYYVIAQGDDVFEHQMGDFLDNEIEAGNLVESFIFNTIAGESLAHYEIWAN